MLGVAIGVAPRNSTSARDGGRVNKNAIGVGAAAAFPAAQLDTTAKPPPLIAHPEHTHPGLPDQRPAVVLRNPRERDPRALEEGKVLFVSYNCADCHASDGTGAMGPSLADGRWHFGGSPGEVYESISQGRPDGMPAWGGRIPDSQIWALVRYVQSLGAGADVSTENFEGATVERGGH